MFTIEKGIPVPASGSGSTKKACPYPLSKMVVGDSFLVANSAYWVRQEQKGKINYQISRLNKELAEAGLSPQKFSVREIGTYDLRVWRTL